MGNSGNDNRDWGPELGTSEYVKHRKLGTLRAKLWVPFSDSGCSHAAQCTPQNKLSLAQDRTATTQNRFSRIFCAAHHPA